MWGRLVFNLDDLNVVLSSRPGGDERAVAPVQHGPGPHDHVIVAASGDDFIAVCDIVSANRGQADVDDTRACVLEHSAWHGCGHVDFRGRRIGVRDGGIQWVGTGYAGIAAELGAVPVDVGREIHDRP